MKYREFKSVEAGRREAQIMIRHPNNSGMQMISSRISTSPRTILIRSKCDRAAI